MSRTRRSSSSARLVDVAARAGVNVSTASRALNHPEMVRPETRARVLAAADALRYTPNPAARDLSTGRMSRIAIVVPDITNGHFGRMCRAAQATARARGFEVYAIDTGGYGSSEEELLRSTSRLVGGIVLCGSTHAFPPAPFGAPIAYVNRRARGAHCVLLDPISMVQEPIDHLVALGHRRIDWAAGPTWGWSAGQRLHAIEHLAADHDIRVLHTGGVDFPSGVELADRYDGRATAIVCYTDRQAIGFLGRAAALGIRVPEDVSVVGAFDGPTSAYANPPLTTYVVPQEEMGSAAVRLLIDLPPQSGRTVTETVRGHLAVRGSTAPPRRGIRARR